MAWLSKRRKRFLAGLLTATAVGAAFCLVSHFNLLYVTQLRSSDLPFRAASLQQSTEPAEKIVIVAIDDQSLGELGHFSSWPRSYHAQLIDILAEAGARTIVFDVLFSEPASDDEQLADSIKHAQNVILPLASTVEVHQSPLAGEAISSADVIKPLKPLEDSALAIGHANVIIDDDGVVRRLPLVIPNDGHQEPALALATVAKYLRRPQVIEAPIKDNSLPLAGRLVPLDDTNSLKINYTADSVTPLSFNTVPYVDVLRNNIDAAILQDRIVIIGVTATGLGDTFWTPMGRMMSGVELHASAMHTILTGNFLKPAPSWITFASIIILALLCGLATLRLRMRWAILSAGLLIIGYFLIAFAAFDNGIILNMLHPPLTIIGAFVGVNIYQIASERTEKREITNLFGRYVSPSVVDKILLASADGELKLGGEEHEITTLFADVRGFTGIAERLPPQELVRTLNVYLSVIIKAILKHDGMIDKFGGDSVMAVWNVPVKCEEHAFLATKAAISAQRAIEEMREKEPALARMEFGIGLDTGEAVAGNMGDKDRLEYSVIGDVVNTAARLAGAAPGGKVWIGADALARIKEHIEAKPLEPLAVKGKCQPIQAYEVVDIPNGQKIGKG